MVPSAELQPDKLRLDRDGAQLFRAAASAETVETIGRVLADQLADQAGVRLYGLADLRPFIAASGPLGAIAASKMNGTPLPVRAILFDKTASTNWSLAWHQDRVIAVRERIAVEGFGSWTRKHGALHVAPPFEVLARMTTLRFHLDDVPETNAPLLIAPGSHRFGRIAEADVPKVVERCGVAACPAEVGDAWLYATSILHASEAARQPAHRRVLQVDYAVGELPGGLEWLGV
jgi:hypothetical protein